MLHTHGSNNPNGVTGNVDRLAMHPYFTFKDLVTVFAFLLVLTIFVCWFPNVLGHSDNYVPSNPMATPSSIVPEWYKKDVMLKSNLMIKCTLLFAGNSFI